MSPVIIILEVPYAENEQQFLIQAVRVAVRTFRSLNVNPSDGFGKVSVMRTNQMGVSSSPPGQQ